MVEFLEGGFVFGRGDTDFFHASTDGHEEEDRPHGDSLIGKQFTDGVDLVEVPPRDGGVNLNGELQFAGVGEHAKGSFEATLPAAEGIVGLGVGAIQTDPEGADAGLLDTSKGVACRQGGGRGGQGNLEVLAACVADEVEEVGAFEWVAAGQHQDRLAWEGGHLIDERHGHFGRQFILGRFFLGRGAAMLADEITGLGDLVVEHEWIASEVGRGVGGVLHGDSVVMGTLSV